MRCPMRPHLLTCLIIALITLPLAVPAGYGAEDGGDLWFKDTRKMPPVLFSHAKHQAAGNQCTDCHDGVFQKKAGTADTGNALTMKSLRQGQFCGTCHDGEKTFSVKKHCKKCHLA